MPEYMPYMQMMSMPGQCCPMMQMPSQCYPMMQMPQEQLESMYPRVYHIIHPHVKRHCDMFDAKHGTMCSPTREQFESMVDDIHRSVEVEVEVEVSIQREGGDRQLGFGGGRLLRDLIAILLLRQLLFRRRPFFRYGEGYGYMGGYDGYPGGYGAY